MSVSTRSHEAGTGPRYPGPPSTGPGPGLSSSHQQSDQILLRSAELHPQPDNILYSEGQVHPFFSPDSSYPLLYKTALTLERSQLSCDWRRHRHYCRLNHFLTCLRSDQVQEPHRRSSVYISTAGGLANHMSTFAATLAIQHRLGVRGLIDLTAFQILDQVFNNIRGSGLEILEEVVCDPAGLVWESFEGHVRDLDPGALGQGKMLTLWLQGISVAEHVR